MSDIQDYQCPFDGSSLTDAGNEGTPWWSITAECPSCRVQWNGSQEIIGEIRFKEMRRLIRYGEDGFAFPALLPDAVRLSRRRG